MTLLDFEKYRYTKLSTFHNYDSWVGLNETQNIPKKSLRTLKNFYNESEYGFRKIDFLGGDTVKFLGGIFDEDEMLLFFDVGMFFCQGYWTTKFFVDTERPRKLFWMRYDFNFRHVYKNNFIRELNIECVGIEYTKNTGEVERWVNDEKERYIDPDDFLYKHKIKERNKELNHLTSQPNGFFYYMSGGRYLKIISKDIHESLEKIQNDINSRKKKKENFEKVKEKKRVDVLNKKKGSIVDKFDKDKNGTIDIIEDKNEFNLLLKKHQKIVIEKGKEFNENYTHQFIKVGNYIKQKRSNLQLIFDCIKQVQNQKDLSDFVKILEGEIHSYNLLLINSLNLIVSLIEDDQITFYEIYERFDKLNIFNSNWENEVSDKLSELNKEINELNQNLKGVMYEIRDMGDRIVNSIEDLSYITEESTKMLDNRLGEIDSSIKTNNLLTLINTYQTYKINKNTKSLRG